MNVGVWLAVPVRTGVAQRCIVAAGSGAFALAALLYLARPDLYFSLLPLFFFFDHPFRYPFHDIGGVMAAVECWRAGVDVYLSNPCDTENRPWPYSPLLLRLWFLPTDRDFLPLVGSLLALGFIGCQRLLPAPERRIDLCLVLAVLLSPSVVFALERANIDALIFMLLMLVAVALRGSLGWRLLAYGLIALCGFLKFYPFVAIAVVLRERLRTALTVLALFALAVGLYVWRYGAEIERALQLVRSMDGHWSPFSDRFGARQLAVGLWSLVGEQGYKNLGGLFNLPSPSVPSWLLLAMLLSCLMVAIWLARRPALRGRWQQLPPQRVDFLVVGALIFVGCFFAGYSNVYRAIFLLPVLPALLSLARDQVVAAPRWLRWAPVALVYSLWAPTTQHLIQYAAKLLAQPQAGAVVQLLDWLLHELAWWWIATLCTALLLRYLFEAAASAGRQGSSLPRLHNRLG